jgi:hypothetical protein
VTRIAGDISRRPPFGNWLLVNLALVPAVVVLIELARWVVRRGDLLSEAVLVLWWLWVPFALATVPFLLLLYRLPRTRLAAVLLAAAVVVTLFAVDAVANRRLPWTEPENLWLGVGYPILYSLVVRLPARTSPR